MLRVEQEAESGPPAAFVGELQRLPLEDLLERTSRATAAEARRALSESPLSLWGAAALLKTARGRILDTLLTRARSLTDACFGRSILLYAPCYLSSLCVNHCLYCGFNSTNSIPRRCLTPEETVEEISLLAERGMKRVLLVAGEYPAKVTPDYIADTIVRARSVVRELDLEVGPVPTKAYRKWVQAGAGGVLCYQETYDPVQYARLHPRGPKSLYECRLGTLERAGEAGMKRLGLGVLLGLADPTRDLLALIAHARFLERLFPNVRLTVSLPRIRPAVPSFHPTYHVDDESLIRFFAILRLALPRVGLVVSTRERPKLRQCLLEAGITQMSAGSVAVPGGYGSGEREAGQFELADLRSVAEIITDLDGRGYAVRW